MKASLGKVFKAVGNGFTRWVDGQKALSKPELGLSNWQFGRLFGRGGILTGDGVLTVGSAVSHYLETHDVEWEDWEDRHP